MQKLYRKWGIWKTLHGWVLTFSVHIHSLYKDNWWCKKNKKKEKRKISKILASMRRKKNLFGWIVYWQLLYLKHKLVKHYHFVNSEFIIINEIYSRSIWNQFLTFSSNPLPTCSKNKSYYHFIFMYCYCGKYMKLNGTYCISSL